MHNHPAIWFSLWTTATCFLWAVYFGIARKTEVLTCNFLFVWASLCTFWVTTFHTRWLLKWDAKQYKKQKLKDEWEAQKWLI
jgi:hypothetical protein